MKTTRYLSTFGLAACFSLGMFTVRAADAEKPPLLLTKPTLSQTHVAFVYARDLWTVPRAGGEAKRLTSGVGVETDPFYSPDGKWIALTGEYDGNVDVYVIASGGGIPQRLTWHPGTDTVVGWSHDGKGVLFRSGRSSFNRFNRLFTVPREGGYPTELPLPMAEEGCFSPDGKRIAYLPIARAFAAWKRYAGGRTTKIWLADLADSKIEKVPRDNSNDFNPMWVGDKIYFLSDRNGPVTLFTYDTKSRQVKAALENKGLDLKAACAGPGGIVFEQFGSLHLFDAKSGKAKKLDVVLSGDLPEVRPRLVKVSTNIGNSAISPSGARAVFEARGDIFTVPAEKGDVRNLTQTPGVAERDPSWSPDGRWIACFSDESGEYALHLREQSGRGETRKITLGTAPSFYYGPVWSPDSKKIAYTDKRLNLWFVDIEKPEPRKVDENYYSSGGNAFGQVWSPDSKWLAYHKQLKTMMRAVFVCPLDGGEPRQITDGMSDARFPAWDRTGKYLYFTASTDIGPSINGFEMTSYTRQSTRSVYLAVLRKDLPSPFLPESDEERVEEKKDELKPADTKPSDAKAGDAPDTGKKVSSRPPAPVKIDFDNISQRIIPLPLPARNYVGVVAGKTNQVYLLERATGGVAGRATTGEPTGTTVSKFDVTKRKTEKFADGLASFELAANLDKALVRQGDHWAIVSTAAPLKPDEGTLKLDGMELFVEPATEWAQMYREVWRIERDFLYATNHHGLDLRAAQKKYEPWLAGLSCRDDLNYLFQEMLGELSIGHLYVQGGDRPDPKRVKGGLLGADYRIENGRYRFDRVYNGENWNPQLRAPLTQPGVNVVTGEYLLAVNGRNLAAPQDNPHRLLEATAGKSVLLHVGPNPDGTGARDVSVVPTEDETSLRTLAWVEDNRRKVDALSGGRLAYVHLPDTATGGFTFFNRYYFAQVHKDGAVIDERFNRGGQLANYIIDYLRQDLVNYWATRDGHDFPTPVGAMFGPKAMLVNEYAGSGGDYMPWAFRKAGIGPLIGQRTWGGLVGIGGYPTLMDGGTVTAPHLAFWNPDGRWEIENHGVAPDIEVEFDPAAVRAGKDPQLEKAVEVLMVRLTQSPPKKHERPPFPDYHNKKSPAPAGGK